jgi:ribosomal subunit interface protein
MDIRVAGHQVETGEALQNHAAERLTAIVEKYFSRGLSSQVTFNRGPANAFRCDIVTHVMQGLILKGAAQAPDAHIALDQAAEKIDKQLRRYKRRLKDRHEASTAALRAEEAAYVVFAEPEPEAEEVAADAPLVIAETRVDVPEATVGRGDDAGPSEYECLAVQKCWHGTA